MTTRVEAEVNDRAGRLSNGVAELLVASGIENAVVWVADPTSEKWPLAIRNTRNDGFWGVGPEAYHSFQLLARQARKQVDYARTAAGRSAAEQVAKLEKTKRSATSYGYDFNQRLDAGFVVDGRSQLTVVGVADKVETPRMVELVTRAVSDVENGRTPSMLEAGKWLHACYAMLESRLKSDDSGISMIALPYIISRFTSEIDPGPVIVASQTVGKSVDTAKFSIVGAKVMATAQTGKPSGTLAGEDVYKYSNIQGALPVKFGEYGYRIAAMGGLVDVDDVKSLKDVAEGDVGLAVSATILSELPNE